LRKQVDDLRTDADIEGGDWLIGDDEFGAEGEGAGDTDALALASAEFVGEARQDGFVEADGADQFEDAGAEADLELRCLGLGLPGFPPFAKDAKGGSPSVYSLQASRFASVFSGLALP